METQNFSELKALVEEKLDSELSINLFTCEILEPSQENEISQLYYCSAAAQMLYQLCSLSPKLELKLRDINTETELTQQLGIYWTPGIAFQTGKAFSPVRYFGLPYGYDFALLLDLIFNISKSKADVSEHTLLSLLSIDYPIQIKVFVSSSCPLCPIAAHFATHFALASPNITATIINALQFEDLARSYEVRALPTVIINENKSFFGITSEKHFLESILKAPKQNKQNTANELNYKNTCL